MTGVGTLRKMGNKWNETQSRNRDSSVLIKASTKCTYRLIQGNSSPEFIKRLGIDKEFDQPMWVARRNCSIANQQ